MKATAMLIAGIYLCAAAPAHSDSFSFRELNANSVKSDVLTAFPHATEGNDCRDGEDYSRSSDGLTQCKNLTVAIYELDNIPFTLTFMFSVEGFLRYVSLDYAFGYGRNEEGLPLTTVRSSFWSLADLISSKYGSTVTDPPSSLRAPDPSRDDLEWQPTNGIRWQAGGDRISLSSYRVESRTNPGLYKGTLQIFYTFARRDQFKQF